MPAQKNEEKLTIHQRIFRVFEDARFLEKNNQNNYQKFMFRGVDDVVNLFGPLMRKHGIIPITHYTQLEHDLRTLSGGKATMVSRVLLKLKFMDSEGDTVDVGQIVGEAFDTGDKATAKAQSVAYRDLFLKTFVLPTGDPDPDHDIYEVAPNVARGMTPQQKAYAEERIKNAKTVDDLIAIWNEAKQVGLATQELNDQLGARRAELEGDLAQQVMNGKQANG